MILDLRFWILDLPFLNLYYEFTLRNKINLQMLKIQNHKSKIQNLQFNLFN